ncbi:HugZ family protein [Brevibacillus sp. SAFN-007a]|uniref:HugZ family pyridoxamine 5'-phosphate oxidase n=1 Tax=Brevibacillus sp. SAFN-007a TaxID=3436862 RepID=UPI003F7FDF9A
MKAAAQEAMKVQYQTFAAGMKTLVLSTVDEHGKPFVSYAPFVQTNGKFYIYISKIANHYRYLEETRTVDAMLIEDEAKTANLFARQRARFVCTASNIGNAGHDEIFALFEERFGKSMMDMLRGLDFSLFELAPSTGRYIAGFGQAYDINLAADQFEHVNRDGHTPTAN